MQAKKKQLASSKSQYFPENREKEQMQRKLTYNLVRQPDEVGSEHSFIKF